MHWQTFVRNGSKSSLLNKIKGLFERKINKIKFFAGKSFEFIGLKNFKFEFVFCRKQNFCNMGIASTNGALYYIFIGCNVASPIVYFLIWIKIEIDLRSNMRWTDGISFLLKWENNTKKGAFLDTRKLFAALCLIVFVNLVAWMIIPLTSFVILPLAHLSPLGELTLSTIILSIVNQLGFSAMPIVLFLFW